MKKLLLIIIFLFTHVLVKNVNAQGWIVSTQPALNLSNVNKDINITVVFDRDMNATTINSSNVKILGSQSGKHLSNLSYDNLSKTLTINPNIDFSVGENVNVILSSKIKSTTGDSLPPYNLFFKIKVYAGIQEFQVSQTITGSPTNHNIVGCDINNDNFIDLIKTNGQNNTVTTYKNLIDSFAQNQVLTLANSNPHWNAIGDFNNDGFSDLAIVHMGSDKLSILLNQGNGNYIVDSVYSVGDGPFKVVSADFNNDGNMDLAFLSQFSHYLDVYTNNGLGKFYKSFTNFIGGRPIVLASSDFNNDGFSDLAVTKFDGKDLLIFTNNKNNSFNKTDSLKLIDNPGGIISYDFDNDKFMDLAIAGWYSQLLILKNNSQGQFSISQTISNQTGYMVDAGDFDNDGDLDILANCNINDSIRIFYNNGSGSFINFKNYFANTNAGYADVIADFENDGDLDIAIGSYSLGTLTILKNKSGLQQGLIAYYPFNGNANDISGNNRHGIIQGNPALVPDRFGNPNGAFSFDGIDDRIKLPNFSIGDTTVDKTVCAWFKVMNDSVYTYLFTMQTDTTDWTNPKYFLIEANRNSINVTEVIFPFFNLPPTIFKTITPNQYHFIAVVSSNSYVGNKTKIYLDGIYIGSLNQKVIRNQPIKHIGWSMQWGGLAYGFGTMDELRIYNRALNENEIFTLYTILVEVKEVNISASFNTVYLNWKTATEKNNKGFAIYRDDNYIDFVEGKGTTLEPNSYRYSDSKVPIGKHYYRIIQQDYDGSTKEIAKLEVFVSGEVNSYVLSQNYPNPFNPTTTIDYQLSANGFVTITIYNSIGEVVKTLVNETKEAGFYSAAWDGKNEMNEEAPSGLYIYQIKSGSFLQSKKMLLLK